MSIVLIFALLNGCSAFVPYREDVKITASEPGADVYVNDQLVGQSPVTVKLARNDSYVITSSSDPLQFEDSRRVSFAGALDIAGTIIFLFPIIGCFTPGFWTLDDTDVHLKNAVSSYVPPAS